MKRKLPTMITLIIKKYRKKYFRKGEGKTLKIIENNYIPSSVRVTCPICYSIFEFDPDTEWDKEEFKTYKDGQGYIERTITCPCCNKSFLIEGNYSWRVNTTGG